MVRVEGVVPEPAVVQDEVEAAAVMVDVLQEIFPGRSRGGRHQGTARQANQILEIYYQGPCLTAEGSVK